MAPTICLSTSHILLVTFFNSTSTLGPFASLFGCTADRWVMNPEYPSNRHAPVYSLLVVSPTLEITPFPGSCTPILGIEIRRGGRRGGATTVPGLI